MHTEARAFIERAVAAWPAEFKRSPTRVLDVGGRDVNGTPRDLFGDAEWCVADIVAEPGVDVLWDAREPMLPWLDTFDVGISTEVLEHVDGWERVVANLLGCIRPGGRFLITAAAEPRMPHSGVDGWELRPGEYYGNVDPDYLREVLRHCDAVGTAVHYDSLHGDVYAEGLLV